MTPFYVHPLSAYRKEGMNPHAHWRLDNIHVLIISEGNREMNTIAQLPRRIGKSNIPAETE
ncbi:MAG: hypothetical protein C4527_14125 [Candidatus Omnitrophota bacterium]|jgi:hypothetical protein|nr:MAG: hypothetical protein C4527_14125 [Candidatus Omnitrophota bacterium]